MKRKRRRIVLEKAPRSWMERITLDDVRFSRRVKLVRFDPKTRKLTLRAKGNRKIWRLQNGKWKSSKTVTISLNDLTSRRTEDNIFLRAWRRK